MNALTEDSDGSSYLSLTSTIGDMVCSLRSYVLSQPLQAPYMWCTDINVDKTLVHILFKN